MNKFVGAFALICRDAADQSQFLTCWNERTHQLEFVAAERLEGETYRDSLLRELGWTLRVDANRQLVISHAPRIHLNCPVEISCGTPPTFYVIEFYLGFPFGRSGADAIAANPNVAWLSPEELHSGQAADGRTFSPVQRLLLSQAGLIPSLARG